MSGGPAVERQRILVVDDATANLQLLTRLLTEHGYAVSPASDGELALDFVRTTLPDLILLDVRMPRMDGFEVCRRLKADPRTRPVPVVLVSALEDERAKVTGFREGAVDYITKPFQAEEVLARVALHLRLRELAERLEHRVGERTEELLLANARLHEEVAERAAAEQALRASQERARQQYSTLRGIIDSHNAPVFSLDRYYRYTSFNQAHAAAMKTLYGADIELGHGLLGYFTLPEDRQTTKDNLDRALAGNQHLAEASTRDPSGSRTYFQVSYSPIPEESGHVIGVAVLAQDITARRRAEEVTRELNRDLEQRVLDRTRQLQASTRERDQAFRELQQAHARILQQENMASIGQLAAGIAHEINTPTQYLTHNLDFLAQSFRHLIQALPTASPDRPPSAVQPARPVPDAAPDPDVAFLVEEVPRALRESRDGVRQIVRIISAMKDFARPGTNGPEPTDLPHLIGNVVEMSRNEWGPVARLDVTIDPQASTLTCLPDRLGHVLLNLLLNAAHAIADAHRPPGDGRIQIRVRGNGDHTEIQVEDNGCGIPSDVQPRIFEPFFTTRPVGQGSGQGLAIAYDIIVNTHHGHITVDSTPGAGATFTLRLRTNGPRPPDQDQPIGDTHPDQEHLSPPDR